MKKIFLVLLVLLLFITGCSNYEKGIKTIIKEDYNMLIGINYPITNTKLDIYIENDIKKIESDFKNKYQILNKKSELNIDYSYNKVNNYISVVLNIYINSPKINKPINYVLTYLFDENKNVILKDSDIIDIKYIKPIIIKKIMLKYPYINITQINKLLNNLKIGFDYQNINIFINHNQLLEVNIPIYECKTKIDIYNRNINKVFKKIDVPNKIINPNDKVIALTFDDGPSIYTDKIIEYLHDNDCSATFFVLGNKVSMYEDTIKKSVKYGNEIGNHSYNHKWLIKLSNDEIKNQIDKTQEIIKETTGITPVLLRPTYGSTNNYIKSLDLKITLWNVDTLDWKYKSVNKIVTRATKNLKDGNIILMHDIHNRTYEAVKKIVPIIKEQGYVCVTVSELNEINLIRKSENEK